jgi:glycosyltransferase involved in cell wall biosynthesis
MKILILIGQLSRGGAEQQLVYLLSQLAPPVTVVSFTPGGYWAAPIRAFGHTVIELDRRSHYDVRRLLRVMHIIRTQRPEVIHLFLDGVSGLYGRIAALIVGHPRLIVGERNIPTYYPRWFQRLLPLLNRFPVLWVANSHAAAVYARAHRLVDPNKIQIIPNGLDMVRILDAPAVDYPFPQSWRGKTIIAQIGGLAKRKNPLRFVRIASLLGNYDARFVLVGDGELRGDVETAIRELDLKDRVLLMGERADVPGLLRHIDILALTSDHEGTPNVILEGFAVGIPAVVTAVGDAPVLVENAVRGFHVPPDDEEEFADALAVLIDHPERRHEMGEQARAYVVQFSIPAMAAAYQAIYHQVLEA